MTNSSLERLTPASRETVPPEQTSLYGLTDQIQ